MRSMSSIDPRQLPWSNSAKPNSQSSAQRDALFYLTELLSEKALLLEAMRSGQTAPDVTKKVFQRSITTFQQLGDTSTGMSPQAPRRRRSLEGGPDCGEDFALPEAPTTVGAQDRVVVRNLVSRFKKIPMSQHGDYNLIARLLGPCGLTIRQLERDTGCTIRIKGRGSVKDPEKEANLRGRRGWEHLREPLHVFIMATENSVVLCEQKLNHAATVVSALLQPVHDLHKQQQLIQYAMITGTYQQRNLKKTSKRI